MSSSSVNCEIKSSRFKVGLQYLAITRKCITGDQLYQASISALETIWRPVMVTDRSVFTGGLVSTITGSETFTVVRPAKSTARNKYEICPLLKNFSSSKILEL